MKNHKDYIPNLLRPSEVRSVLHDLDITWQDHKVKANGWVRIKNPLRKDGNFNFSIKPSIGAFADHSNPKVKGDLIKLVMLIHKLNRHDAEHWILAIVGLAL